MTTLVDKLIRLGYAAKKQDDTDNRCFRISLTPKGRALKSHLVEISDRLIAKVYKDLPVVARQQLVTHLKKINSNW